MRHHLSFHKMKPQDVFAGGYRTRATKSDFPTLQNMSLYKLVLHKQAIREPHWHANTDELGYCLKGKLLVSLFGNRFFQGRLAKLTDLPLFLFFPVNLRKKQEDH